MPAEDWHHRLPVVSPSFDRPAFVPTQVRDLHAHSFLQGDPNAGLGQGIYDPYVTSTTPLGGTAQALHQASLNPYSNEQPSNGATSYFQNNAFAQPPQYHLYTSLAPHRENIPSQQRVARDFFISDQLREELQRKSAAQLQILPSEL